MMISQRGLDFLKDCEGFRAKAYLDTGGIWTIGFGTTRVNGIPIGVGQVCTEKIAEVWLNADCAEAQTAVNQLVHHPLTQNQFDALVSFVYNVGIGAFVSSTMLRKLNLGEMNIGPQFDRWVFDNGRVIPGLVSRRARERSLFEQ